ncbi:hypothetical protein IQ249_22305 [Lusitaniella coriacea LEGE 07157]|uniref:Uncharacterized protein n=1 Tax=Lusitaniella coriacea LEGE 07157 TaxID=945747 RepID=A0A8J7DZP4_9CYAN|nr:hypothetical protein [Lusitaniella coriacea]MBE9118626.1 hypothetical protein [Lusitaniella coriacea LEGE 07157]
MPRTKKTESTGNVTSSTQTPEDQIAQAIADRYFEAIPEVAPKIASEFWRRLDGQVATEIVKQRDRGFLASVGERLSQLPPADATINAIAGGAL